MRAVPRTQVVKIDGWGFVVLAIVKAFRIEGYYQESVVPLD